MILFNNEKSPYALDKIVQMPDNQKMIQTYRIKYKPIKLIGDSSPEKEF